MPPIPWRVQIQGQPGSSLEEIENEPDWRVGHHQRVGYTNRDNRKPGLTHEGDERDKEVQEVVEQSEKLKEREDKGDLVNFRDVVQNQKDLHLHKPKNRPLGWRFVLQCTEDWVKNKEEWPANVQKRKKEEEAKEKQDQDQDKDKDKDQNKQKRKPSGYGEAEDDKQPQQEHEWKRQQGENKHHDAYGGGSDPNDGGPQPNGEMKQEKSEDEKLRGKYSPQEIALLRSLQNEKEYIQKLRQNDGKGESPVKDRNRTTISISEADQFSPDNWIPRSDDLIRLTGKHPLNAEADLTELFEAGLITPNELHYVRNHASVPRLLWETHELEIEGGKLVLSMDDLKNKFDAINIPIALACDGNRRKELNMIKKSKGFSWGAAAVSCAYWKGPLLRDVLMAAGVPEHMHQGQAHERRRHWVNVEGADDPSEGKYATSIPFQYAMDPTNDVILAYEMNNVPLPPDHGYPVRLMIPGHVGGRCIKWVRKIWITDKENDSYYHIWDNRVLPSFVTEKDGEFAETLFRHPDTACNEQNLNSVIVKPAQGEKIPVTDAKKGKLYRVKGYAYDGAGHEVQRVEVSLDEGETWLYCIRKFPEAPIRHGNKFWTWLHWHVDVETTHLLRAKSITVRCFNVFKNTQPQRPNWNVMGMMNNSWYTVKPEITTDPETDIPSILFRHPVEPGTGNGGWMEPSVENRIASVKQEAGTPQKQFTRQEIEKHDKENDCWIVVDGKVYDATSVLSWHPGGKAAILGHAGKVHQETSEEFESIHDGFAYQKLKECALGAVTEKAMNYIKQTAEAKAKEKAKSSEDKDRRIVLEKHRWVPVTLKSRKSISDDTRTYTFELPDGKTVLGLGTCQHVQLGFHMLDRMLIRLYTPTRPLLPPANDSGADQSTTMNGHPQTGDDDADNQRDGSGTFDLTIKTYFPDANQPGGAMSNILDCIPLGSQVDIRGPTGEITYNGHGNFTIENKAYTFNRINLVLGGSGITPGYALIARVLLTPGDRTRIRVVDANKTEKDILLRDELDGFEKDSEGQLKVTHVLSHAGDRWKGLRGHVSAEILRNALFPPLREGGGDGDGEGREKVVSFLCGPPTMIQKAVLPALTEWGFAEEKNMFGF